MADATSAITTWAGVSIGSLITGTGVWAIVGGAVTYWIRSRPILQKQRNEADGSLRGDLLDRIKSLEAGALVQTSKLEQQRDHYERKIDQKDAAHAAEMAVMRHRLNNMDQSLTMLLTLIEETPERAQQAAKRVREQRALQELAEATEQAGIHAARINAAGSRGPIEQAVSSRPHKKTPPANGNAGGAFQMRHPCLVLLNQ